MTEKYSVDRVEDGVIVLVSYVDGNEINVPSEDYSGLSDGDIVNVSFGEDRSIINIEVDKKETKRKKRSMKKKLRSLFDN